MGVFTFFSNKWMDELGYLLACVATHTLVILCKGLSDWLNWVSLPTQSVLIGEVINRNTSVYKWPPLTNMAAP